MFIYRGCKIWSKTIDCWCLAAWNMSGCMVCRGDSHGLFLWPFHFGVQYNYSKPATPWNTATRCPETLTQQHHNWFPTNPNNKSKININCSPLYLKQSSSTGQDLDFQIYHSNFPTFNMWRFLCLSNNVRRFLSPEPQPKKKKIQA